MSKKKPKKPACPACKSTKIAMCFGRAGHGWKCTNCNSWLVREDY